MDNNTAHYRAARTFAMEWSMAVGVLVHVNSNAAIVARTTTLGDLKDELLKFNSHPAPGSLSLNLYPISPFISIRLFICISVRFSLSISLYVSISLYSYQSIFRTYYTATLITEVEGE